ncbi:MmgE/PrpD family protein [Thalassotalea mangrovi]|uniref:MmgE/PrpD family protein n=1 Tax=Thalassotalea mangrovi TaxID=2572245 RepID=A0A4V5NWV3_9GAMM|nr:MmgE/PrpD family protein [Thalassotalea mangrovi]TKB43278.1 MmgE/PrpD family protein [Thalassotalea mangrovi]
MVESNSHSTTASDERNAMQTLLSYIESQRYENLPQSVIVAAKTFILDSIGVGISGSRHENLPLVKAAVNNWGAGKQAQVWATGEWLPASSAATINGYQIHNQEWDCVHEEAVVHPMATILSALMAYGQQHNVSGQKLILGVVVAVDVATLIGASATSGLKFFRPSVCGCLGATAGICAMLGITGSKLANALGIAYSQISGTMQSHLEGSPMLAMQIAFNAKNAIQAADLARQGFSGPKDILEGPFGYFTLFEDGFDLTQFYQKLGYQYQIEQISHKPFPTGRAGHGVVDALQVLQTDYEFTPDQIEQVTVEVTPLIYRLVARPIKEGMDVSYAKLCIGYIGATALLKGSVDVDDFAKTCLHDPNRLRLGAKFQTQVNDIIDPNALAPISVTVQLSDGQTFSHSLPAILGHPHRPLSKAAQLQKFRAACHSAHIPMKDDEIDKLINRIDELPAINNINDLVQMMMPSSRSGSGD